jgi:hypothetical protein
VKSFAYTMPIEDLPSLREHMALRGNAYQFHSCSAGLVEATRLFGVGAFVNMY